MARVIKDIESNLLLLLLLRVGWLGTSGLTPWILWACRALNLGDRGCLGWGHGVGRRWMAPYFVHKAGGFMAGSWNAHSLSTG